MHWLSFFLLFESLYAYSIVFVHIGKDLPTYLPTAIAQARLFNPEADLYLIGESRAFSAHAKELNEHHVIQVATTSLSRSSNHQRFIALTRHEKSGFWLYTTERFFYLEELIRQRNLTDVFHMESDIMLYVDLARLLPVFHAHYSNAIAATFEDDLRCVAGFMYIPHILPIEQLCKFFAQRPRDGETDMDVLGQFMQSHHKRYIDDLPVLPPRYASCRTFQHTPQSPERYSNCFEAFDSIFDAACIGQYLGGISPDHIGHAIPGYINPYCCFWVSDFAFEWERDEQGRLVPFFLFEGEKKRVNNLHVHCKELKRFYSLN